MDINSMLGMQKIAKNAQIEHNVFLKKVSLKLLEDMFGKRIKKML